MRIRTTCVICLTAVCVLASANLAQASEPPATTYRDPANRFAIAVPAGWKIRPLGDSVQIVRGDSYASVLIFDHTPDVDALVEELGQKMGKKWNRFESLGHAESTLAGLQARAISFSGENAQGLPAMLKLSGVSVNHTAYVLVIGATKNELPKTQETLAQIEHSFTLLAGEKPAAEEPNPSLGLEVTDLGSDDAAGFGLRDTSGALVVSMAENGPAQQAGVLLHDLIVTAGGQNIDSAAMLQQVLKSHKSGDVIELEILRLAENTKVEHITLKATLTALPKSP
ncbi:MAG: PDZ domain-containing protein [Acidobacteriia bacterium]|nr:PDZ domain-containing protein [Terriglobia bacterium]